MKIKSIFLTISLLSFAIGFSDLQENIVFWLGRPVGAITFVAYFILVLLEKEYALYDEAQVMKVERSEIKRTRSVDARADATALTISGAQ